MKIDLHTHMLPERWPDFATRLGYGDWPTIQHGAPGCARMLVGGKPFRDIDDQCWDPERRLEACNRHGVDVQVLSTVPVMFCYWAKARDGLDLSRFLNDHLAGVVRDHPGRFAALGTVPLQDADLAMNELERCVRELGMPGIQIGSHVNGANLDDASLFEVLAHAERLGASVFVHPWDMLSKDRMTRYFLPWLVGMPAETSLAICSVIFGGVLERLPALKMGFAHGGGAFPMTLGRIDHAFASRPDLCAVNISAAPSTYLRRLYVDSLVHDPDVLRYLIGLFGADRVALGTDYPFPLGEDVPGSLIAGMNLDEATRNWLLSGSALAFLGFETAKGHIPVPSRPGNSQ